jgi:hypothetical protein
MPQAVRRQTPLDHPQYVASQQLAQQGTVPEGFHISEAPRFMRTRGGRVDLPGTQQVAVQNPSFWDRFGDALPGILAAVGTAGLAAGPALAGTGLLTQAGAGAALNAGMTAGSGGSLKDIAFSGVSGGVPVPTGTSSWLSLIPQIAGAVGQIAGGASAGKSDQRMREGAQTNAANNTELAAYQTQQAAQNQAAQLDLQRKMFGEDARAGRAKQAALADLISNLQDISIDVPGIQAANVTGGLRPSTMGATGRQGMAELSKQALAKLLEGDTFTGGNILTPPTLAGMPQRGGVESTLDWLGLLGSAAGGIGKVLDQTQERGTFSALPGAQGNQGNPMQPGMPGLNPDIFGRVRF